MQHAAQYLAGKEADSVRKQAKALLVVLFLLSVC